MAGIGQADLLPVEGNSSESEGGGIERRRKRLGMDVAQLAREAGVSRTTVHSIEAGGSMHAKTRAKILRALDAAEQEAGIELVVGEAAEVEQIEFQVEGDFGVKVTVRGPMTEHERLREDVAAIIRSIRQDTSRPPAEGEEPTER